MIRLSKYLTNGDQFHSYYHGRWKVTRGGIAIMEQGSYEPIVVDVVSIEVGEDVLGGGIMALRISDNIAKEIAYQINAKLGVPQLGSR